MNRADDSVYFDAPTLLTFAVVDRLDLLRARFGDQARWTRTVAFEIHERSGVRAAAARLMEMAWLGEPVEVGGSPVALAAVDVIRRALGGRDRDPLHRLDEAEIVYQLERREPAAILVTDDRPALDFARRRGLFTVDTLRILQECFLYGEIGCPDAFDLAIQMSARNRRIRAPADHLAVCPR